MQSACCSGRNYLRDQLREMEVRTASSGARAYCTTSVLQHHDAVGVRVTRRTPEAAASWPNRRSCVAAAAGMALGPPTTPQLPSSGSRGSQRIWAREIPTRLLLLAFGRSGRPDLPSRDGDTADRTRTCSNMFPFSYVNSNPEKARRQYARTLPWCAAAWLRLAPAGSCRGAPRGCPARPVGPVCAIDTGCFAIKCPSTGHARTGPVGTNTRS